MTWLSNKLGIERLIGARLIEPSDEFFPETYAAQDEDAIRIFASFRQHMQVDEQRVTVELHDKLSDEDPLGLYIPGTPAKILIRRSQLADPESLVATIAHELAHEVLLGGGHVQDNNEDLERLTDLLTVYLGVGIFGANSTLREQTVREGRFSWWSIQKQGYLPMRMYGYALGLFAWARGEVRPAWSRHLRLDIREPLQKSLRYLEKTGDSTFPAKPLPGVADDHGLQAAIAKLEHTSASFRLLGLQQLIELGTPAAAALEQIAQRLHDRDHDVTGTAAHLLGIIGPPATIRVPDLKGMLASRAANHRECAAFALGEIRPDDQHVINELVRLMDDNDVNVAASAIDALGKYGTRAHGTTTLLLQRYDKALCKCDFAVIDNLATTLMQVVPNAAQRIREHFAHFDADHRLFAEECFAEANQIEPADEHNAGRTSESD
jgi:HEAT repeats